MKISIQDLDEWEKRASDESCEFMEFFRVSALDLIRAARAGIKFHEDVFHAHILSNPDKSWEIILEALAAYDAAVKGEDV